MSEYGAYTHARPDGRIFYVGKGTRKRATNLDRKNRGHRAIVRKYGKDKIKIRFFSCVSETAAFEKEKQLIRRYRKLGIKIVNFSEGGEGNSGYRYTEAQKKKFSERLKNPAVRQNLSRKMKQFYKGNPEAYKKLCERIKRFKKTPEARKQQSVNARRLWKDPEWIQNWKISQKKSRTKESKKKRSISRKKLWSDPIWRKEMLEKLNASRSSEKVREKHRLKCLGQWRDPEYRRKQLDSRNKNKEQRNVRKFNVGKSTKSSEGIGSNKD